MFYIINCVAILLLCSEYKLQYSGKDLKNISLPPSFGLNEEFLGKVLLDVFLKFVWTVTMSPTAYHPFFVTNYNVLPLL